MRWRVSERRQPTLEVVPIRTDNWLQWRSKMAVRRMGRFGGGKFNFFTEEGARKIVKQTIKKRGN